MKTTEIKKLASELTRSVSDRLSMIHQKSVFPALLGAACLGAGSLFITSCEKEGPAERVGKELDEAADKSSDKLDEAAEKAKEEAREAKEKAEEAAENAREKVEEAADAARDKARETQGEIEEAIEEGDQ
ncbi:hypothetical protein [Oceaniferula spumae]